MPMSGLFVFSRHYQPPITGLIRGAVARTHRALPRPQPGSNPPLLCGTWAGVQAPTLCSRLFWYPPPQPRRRSPSGPPGTCLPSVAKWGQRSARPVHASPEARLERRVQRGRRNHGRVLLHGCQRRDHRSALLDQSGRQPIRALHERRGQDQLTALPRRYPADRSSRTPRCVRGLRKCQLRMPVYLLMSLRHG